MLLSVPQNTSTAIEVLPALLAPTLTVRALAPLNGATVPPALWARQRDPNPTPKKKRFRRVSRDAETSKAAVRRAIPKGLRRAKHTDEVLAALEDDESFQSRRSDLRRNLRACLNVLIDRADFATMTTRPGWYLIGKVVEVDERSVGRHLAELQMMGLVAVVASGRSAECAAAGADGQRINEAAVYVLCVPKERQTPESKMARWLGRAGRAVKTNVRPPHVVGLMEPNTQNLPRTRAKNRDSKSLEQRKQNLTVDEVRWNRHRVPESRAQRRTAAWRLKTLVPNVFRQMSDRDIASTVRVFFDAGWSPADIHHALQFQPFDGQWPYAGAPETTAPHRVRGWVKYRLAAWLDAGGVPVASKGQKDRKRWEREAAERAAVTRRERERAEAVRAAANPEVRERALARMRKRLTAAKEAA